MTHFVLSIIVAGMLGVSSMGITAVSSGDTTYVVNGKDSTLYLGKKITEKGAVSVAEMQTTLKKTGKFEGKVKARALDVCQKRGCWMMVDLENGSQMRVSFTDYGFFVPTNTPSGRIVIMEGRASTDTTTVEMLRHYAEDAGKTKEEIAAITQPEIDLAFEADGVIMK